MDVLERADAAEQLLKSAVYKLAHGEIRDEIIRALESVGFDDIEKQHELVLTLQIHNRHKKRLEKWIEEGRFEQKTLDQKNWLERARQRLVR